MPREPARSVIARLARPAEGGIITLDAAARALQKDRRATTRRLGALVRSGWLSRVQRGVYAIRPLEARPGVAIAEEDPWIVASRVFAPCYIAGWTAAGHWELTEQLFRSTFVATGRPVRRSDVVVGSSAFHLARRSRAGGAGLTTVWRGRARVSVSGVERTLVEAFVNPSWVGGVRHLTDIYRAAIADSRLDPAKLIRELRRGATGAALGRLGLLCERYWPTASRVLRYARVHRGSGYVRLDPAVTPRGRLVRRWGVWVNVTLPANGQ